MKNYRKKPVVIQAIQWTGDNLRQVIDFTGLHPSANKWTWDEYEAVVKADGLKIFTLEGPIIYPIGYVIIKGVRGEFYGCAPDIFEATYEDASQLEHAQTWIPVSTRLPTEEDGQVLLFKRGGQGKQPADWKRLHDYSADTTHWMRMPPDPEVLHP